MMYTRASASDYDDWKNVYNNPGWGANDLIPLLQQVRRGQTSCHNTLNILISD